MTGIEACNVPAPAAQAIFKKQLFWRAEKEVDALRKVGVKLVNWKEPEYPQRCCRFTTRRCCCMCEETHKS